MSIFVNSSHCTIIFRSARPVSPLAVASASDNFLPGKQFATHTQHSTPYHTTPKGPHQGPKGWMGWWKFLGAEAECRISALQDAGQPPQPVASNVCG